MELDNKLLKSYGENQSYNWEDVAHIGYMRKWQEMRLENSVKLPEPSLEAAEERIRQKRVEAFNRNRQKAIDRVKEIREQFREGES